MNPLGTIVMLLWVLGSLSPLRAQAPEQDPLAKIDGLIFDARFEEAEAMARACLDGSDCDPRTEAELLERLAVALRKNGKACEPETLRLAKEALEKKTRLYGESNGSVASSLYNLGLLFFARGAFEEAQPWFEKALRIQQEVLGPWHPDVAMTLIQLAGLRFQTDCDLMGAFALLDEARSIQEASLRPDHPDKAWRLMTEGSLLYSAGEYGAAKPCFEEALRIREKCLRPGHPLIAVSHYNLGLLLDVTGDFSGARRHLEANLAMLEQSLGQDHPGLAAAYSGLADFMHRMGDFTKARRFYEKALKIGEKTYGRGSPNTVPDLAGLAGTFRYTRDYPQALALYDQVIAICQGAGKGWDFSRADALVRRGAMLQRMDRLDEASLSYREAGRLLEERSSGSHPLKMTLLHNEATLLFEQGEFEAASELLERLLAMHDQAPEKDHLLWLWTITNLALVRAGTGQRDQAFDLACMAERSSRDNLMITTQTLEGSLALNYAATGTEGLHLMVSLAGASDEVSTVEKTFDSVIRWRALVLDELIARCRAVQASEDPSLAALLSELYQARAGLSRAVVGGTAEEVAACAARKERAERALAEESVLFRKDLAEHRVGFDEIRRGLSAETGLVAYLRIVDRLDDGGGLFYYAFILGGPQAPLRLIPLGPAAQIEEAVEAFQAEFRLDALYPDGGFEQEKRCREAGAGLRERIWDPVVPYLEKMERIFIVPDGALNGINIASLPEREDRYLVEGPWIFHVLTAEREIVEWGDGPASGEGLLILGDPAFGEDDPSAPEGGAYDLLSFAPLDQTAREVAGIRELWRAAGRADEGKIEVLMGEDATEGAFKAKAPGRAVIHLATHGFFLDPDTLESEDRDNPLVYSGLALAGANHGGVGDGEDGILTAEEIASMDLRGVEWAVLSACDTGLGSIRTHEGVFGLRRAFRLAGARTVIMSLWQVDDAFTRIWMEAFYRARIERRERAPEAVRRASLAVLKLRRSRGMSGHPYFWGAFLSAGDWR